MISSTRYCRSGACILALALASLATPVVADTAHEGWRLRAHGVWLVPDAQLDLADVAGDRFRADAGSTPGLGLAGEYRFSRRLGVELGVTCSSDAELEIRLDTATGDALAARKRVTFVALTAGLNLHLTPEARADFSVASRFMPA